MNKENDFPTRILYFVAWCGLGIFWALHEYPDHSQPSTGLVNYLLPPLFIIAAFGHLFPLLKESILYNAIFTLIFAGGFVTYGYFDQDARTIAVVMTVILLVVVWWPIYKKRRAVQTNKTI